MNHEDGFRVYLAPSRAGLPCMCCHELGSEFVLSLKGQDKRRIPVLQVAVQVDSEVVLVSTCFFAR